ncbi:MAG: flagellar export chaperone FliS [Deltaproteobacteria bacterium]|nr:flagellar export chaperone FliS [Deltaproteobacteria bacterium]
MTRKNPYGAYEKTNVHTADQRQLIIMLYDGAIRFLNKANDCIERSDIEGAHGFLLRAREIVNELMVTLRPEKGGKIGENLKRLYVYMFNRLVEANLTKDKVIVDEVISLLSTLREGWSGIKAKKTVDHTDTDSLKRVSVQG